MVQTASAILAISLRTREAREYHQSRKTSREHREQLHRPPNPRGFRRQTTGEDRLCLPADGHLIHRSSRTAAAEGLHRGRRTG